MSEDITEGYVQKSMNIVNSLLANEKAQIFPVEQELSGLVQNLQEEKGRLFKI